MLHLTRKPLALAITAASLYSPLLSAQESSSEVENTDTQVEGVNEYAVDTSSAAPQIEEMQVQGRLMSAAQSLVNERLDDETIKDVLGAEMISRAGDSTVAAALRRVSGLSLVGNKYIYVRGLGERYSSTTLNGAQVPSPDLTRNVLPLDIFPTSIVDSLEVRKAYSAEQTANFGGGNVDIRTKTVPDDFVLAFEVGTGYNTNTSGEVYTYSGAGQSDGLSQTLNSDLTRFNGDFSAFNIGRIQGTSTSEGAEYNKQLATELDRNFTLETKDPSPNFDAKASIGNKWEFLDNWAVGALAGASYESKWREQDSITRSFGAPEEQFSTSNRAANTEDISANFGLGLEWTEDHSVSFAYTYIDNRIDETEVVDYHNENAQFTEGKGFRNYEFKYEERGLDVNQLFGSHAIGDDTKSQASWLTWVPTDTKFDWFYSSSTATTEIPREVVVAANNQTDPSTGSVVSSSVRQQTSAADFRFTELDDQADDGGFSLDVPFLFGKNELVVSAGASSYEKEREYAQIQFGLGPLSVSDSSILDAPLADVFSNDNILSDENDFVLNRSGSNNQSYRANLSNDAAFAKVDWTWDETWRVALGARSEDYSHATAGWDPVSNEEDNASTFEDDKVYSSATLTYMTEFWAERFQLRAGFSETTVRPDLREIYDAIYEDPRTGWAVKGNSDVVPSDLSNFDLRAEWFFDSGDNLTVSAYYKDIVNPIEFFEAAASDTNRLREIVNAESAEIIGTEFEGTKRLGEAFFVQGNLTLQDSELVAGDQADAPTNEVRPMSGASEYVVNATLGFDSPDGMHAATLVYNVFGDRLYAAGRNGTPDNYEKPFHSLDLTYSWYPTDAASIQFKLKNLLDSKLTIEQEEVEIFDMSVGTEISLDFKYAF